MAAELEERFYETYRSQLLRWLPWLHLFRAFRIALDARKVCLGALAAFALTTGDALIDALPFSPTVGARAATPGVFIHDAHLRLFDVVEIRSDGFPGDAPFWNIGAASGVLLPLRTIIEPGVQLFQRGNSWADVAYLWTKLLFHLALWSLLGGAIVRMAAVQFAHRESLTARSAVRYSVSHFASSMGAPLLPLVFVGFFWLICVAIGLVGRVPGIGDAVVGALWFVPLMVGIALAVMLLVIGLSWPLMVATISAEGTDAFDGLSRGYDYVLNRTWYALWLLLLTVVYGAIVVAFVQAVANYGAQLAQWSVGSGMGAENIREMLPVAAPSGLSNPTQMDSPSSARFGGVAATFWLRVLAWLLIGFVISYFWSAVTIIYFLLRLSLDARPLDDVYVPSAPPAPDALPLVGMPASERRSHEQNEASPGTAGPDGG